MDLMWRLEQNLPQWELESDRKAHNYMALSQTRTGGFQQSTKESLWPQWLCRCSRKEIKEQSTGWGSPGLRTTHVIEAWRGQRSLWSVWSMLCALRQVELTWRSGVLRGQLAGHNPFRHWQREDCSEETPRTEETGKKLQNVKPEKEALGTTWVPSSDVWRADYRPETNVGWTVLLLDLYIENQTPILPEEDLI